MGVIIRGILAEVAGTPDEPSLPPDTGKPYEVPKKKEESVYRPDFAGGGTGAPPPPATTASVAAPPPSPPPPPPAPAAKPQPPAVTFGTPAGVPADTSATVSPDTFRTVKPPTIQLFVGLGAGRTLGSADLGKADYKHVGSTYRVAGGITINPWDNPFFFRIGGYIGGSGYEGKFKSPNGQDGTSEIKWTPLGGGLGAEFGWRTPVKGLSLSAGLEGGLQKLFSPEAGLVQYQPPPYCRDGERSATCNTRTSRDTATGLYSRQTGADVNAGGGNVLNYGGYLSLRYDYPNAVLLGAAPYVALRFGYFGNDITPKAGGGGSWWTPGATLSLGIAFGAPPRPVTPERKEVKVPEPVRPPPPPPPVVVKEPVFVFVKETETVATPPSGYSIQEKLEVEKPDSLENPVEIGTIRGGSETEKGYFVQVKYGEQLLQTIALGADSIPVSVSLKDILDGDQMFTYQIVKNGRNMGPVGAPHQGTVIKIVPPPAKLSKLKVTKNEEGPPFVFWKSALKATFEADRGQEPRSEGAIVGKIYCGETLLHELSRIEKDLNTVTLYEAGAERPACRGKLKIEQSGRGLTAAERLHNRIISFFAHGTGDVIIRAYTPPKVAVPTAKPAPPAAKPPAAKPPAPPAAKPAAPAKPQAPPAAKPPVPKK